MFEMIYEMASLCATSIYYKNQQSRKEKNYIMDDVLQGKGKRRGEVFIVSFGHFCGRAKMTWQSCDKPFEWLLSGSWR